VRPSHLFEGTIGDNNADRHAKGRDASGERHGSRTKPHRVPSGARHGRQTSPEATARGEQHGRHKLTVDEVRTIRDRYDAGGVFQTALAAEYGVTQTTIWRVVHRIGWRCLD
jgi:predicted DNA-binding protein (UPF0251 family)